MKLKLYMDVYQGMKFEYACANANPTWKLGEGQKRISFTVEIPDYLIQPEVTVAIQETSVAEQVK